jgi:hypothetical protein
VTISPVIVINIQVIPIQSRLNLNCCMWLNVSVPSESLWKGVTSVSNAGKKRGRGKGVGKKMAKDLNRGQVIGVGEYGFWWQKARNTHVGHWILAEVCSTYTGFQELVLYCLEVVCTSVYQPVVRVPPRIRSRYRRGTLIFLSLSHFKLFIISVSTICVPFKMYVIL